MNHGSTGIEDPKKWADTAKEKLDELKKATELFIKDNPNKQHGPKLRDAINAALESVQRIRNGYHETFKKYQTAQTTIKYSRMKFAREFDLNKHKLTVDDKEYKYNDVIMKLMEKTNPQTGKKFTEDEAMSQARRLFGLTRGGQSELFSKNKEKGDAWFSGLVPKKSTATQQPPSSKKNSGSTTEGSKTTPQTQQISYNELSSDLKNMYTPDAWSAKSSVQQSEALRKYGVSTVVLALPQGTPSNIPPLNGGSGGN